MKTRTDSKSSRLWWSFPALWAAGTLAGFYGLMSYASAAGAVTVAPRIWPDLSGLHRAIDRHTLVMFVHPHCTCSPASLAELSRTINRVRHRMATIVVFVPEGGEPDGVEAGLRDQASTLTDTVVVNDTNGEVERFGAHTSGAALLFNQTGTLVFTGGLTSTRGHEGPSLGQERIVELVSTGAAGISASPVYGCALDDTEVGR